nr:hypothetical protein [Oscillospiraceae bacterium]
MRNFFRTIGAILSSAASVMIFVGFFADVLSFIPFFASLLSIAGVLYYGGLVLFTLGTLLTFGFKAWFRLVLMLIAIFLVIYGIDFILGLFGVAPLVSRIAGCVLAATVAIPMISKMR